MGRGGDMEELALMMLRRCNTGTTGKDLSSG